MNETVIIKATGEKGIVVERGTRHTGRPIALVQVRIGDKLSWYRASEVKAYNEGLLERLPMAWTPHVNSAATFETVQEAQSVMRKIQLQKPGSETLQWMITIADSDGSIRIAARQGRDFHWIAY